MRSNVKGRGRSIKGRWKVYDSEFIFIFIVTLYQRTQAIPSQRLQS